jgi:molybdate transport system ATP-binding protein
MERILVNLQNGGVLYSGHSALKNVSLQIIRGQHWAIVGPSGSGKTTLLEVLAGSRALNSGSITHQSGADDETGATAPRAAVMVSLKHQFRDASNTTSFYYQQRYNSFDAGNTATVDEYLSKLTAAKHQTPAQWTLEQLTTKLHLSALLSKHLIKLSNGETRRLLIAAALLKNPTLLLLDNPLTGLDVKSREELNRLLKEIAQSGISIVLTALARHMPDVVTHVAHLNNGILVKVEKKEDMAAYAPDINIHPGRLQHVKELYAEKYEQHHHQCLISMKNVNINYNNTSVLNNINWQVLPGERWSLSGPNGAGKSTLLSLVNGDNPQAYANDITLFDRKRGSGESIWDIKKNIGFISPELYQYFPADQSCLQVVESGYYDTLGLFRPSHPQRMADSAQWMQALQISQYNHKLFRTIPAGAQRLCLLARALVKCPPLLILDEPCQGLDDEQQENFKFILDAICAVTPVSLVYVTHYAHEIPDAVSHYLRLENGSVAEHW